MKEVSVKKNVLLSTLYQILIMVTPFITAPYVSRVIGPKGIGIYSYTNSIQLYFSMFAGLGTVTYGAREIARNRDNEYRRSKLFWEIEILTIITSSICLILWGIMIKYSQEYKEYYIILTMNLLNTMLDISWFYTGLEQFKYTIMQNSIFKILGIILLFTFIKQPSDLKLYIFIMTLTSLLGTASMWIYLPKFLKKINFREIRILHHFKETLVYFIPTIATSIYTVLDKTLIGAITKNEEENGFYEQATKIINLTKVLTFSSLNAVLGSRISYLFAKDKKEEIKERINNSMNYIFFIGFGIMFGLIGVIDKFVPIFFGDGYEEVASLIKILSPVVVIIGVSNCLGSQYYNPAGLRAKSAKFIIVGSCVNLILNLILIPRFWSYGASVATIIAELTISILYLKFCDGFLTVRNLIKFSWKKIVAGIIMLILVLMIGLLKINTIAVLVLQVIGGVAIYGSILLILKDNFVIQNINKLKNKFIKEKINV